MVLFASGISLKLICSRRSADTTYSMICALRSFAGFNVSPITWTGINAYICTMHAPNVTVGERQDTPQFWWCILRETLRQVKTRVQEHARHTKKWDREIRSTAVKLNIIFIWRNGSYCEDSEYFPRVIREAIEIYRNRTTLTETIGINCRNFGNLF